MILLVFGPDGKRLAGPDWRPGFTDDLIRHFLQQHPTGEVELFDDGEVPEIPPEAMMLVDGQVVADPAYQPPPPKLDPLVAGMVELAEVVKRNVGASVHDKRMWGNKETGKETLLGWIRAHPDCTAEEAEAEAVERILVEKPGEPVIPKLWWEYTDRAGVVHQFGLGASYLFEAIQRGYTAPYVAAGVLPNPVPLTWKSLVALIVATPEEQIAGWLKSL